MNRHPITSLIDTLSRFSGEDPQIINKAGGPGLLREFASIGIIVLVIFVLSFYSSTDFVSNLLNGSHFAAIPIGIVWGLMIVVIYQLLLFTITPAMLIGRERSIKGHSMPVTTEKKGLAKISLIFRISFLVLLAMVVAQPWLVTIFDTSAELENYRHKYRSEFVIQADSSLIGMEIALGKDLDREEELHQNATNPETQSLIREKLDFDRRFLSSAQQLEQQIQRSTSKKKSSSSNTLEDQLALKVGEEETSDSSFLRTYRQQEHKPDEPGIDILASLADLVQKKLQAYRKLDALLSSNNFYTKKIQLINSSRAMAWVVTFFVILVFITPIVLKYHIRNKTLFYKQKKQLEEKIVREEYVKFKSLYEAIFREKFHTRVQFYESCVDPPFNTTRISETMTYTDEKTLLSAIYADKDISDKNKLLISENIS